MHDFFFIPNNKQNQRVLLSEIRYIEAVKKYVKIFTATGNHLVPVSMTYAETMLPGEMFCRIHKSYIISLLHIKMFDSEVVIIGDKALPIGGHYKNSIQQRVNIWGKDLRESKSLHPGVNGNPPNIGISSS